MRTNISAWNYLIAGERNRQSEVRVTVFQNSLALGGTEKAASAWAQLLSKRSCISNVQIVALSDGPRRADLQRSGIQVRIVGGSGGETGLLEALGSCDVVHAHAPGFAHQGDSLGAALRKAGRKIPVVQTNVFGKLENPLEEEWTDFRLFISWTSCVQAAKRSKRKLNQDFFRRQSVAVYPVEDPFETEIQASLRREANAFREDLGITSANVLFGRFSRPEPNKWSPLLLRAFFDAHTRNNRIRLLLREPPAAIAQNLCENGKAVWGGESRPSEASPVIMLRATADPHSLRIGQMACDAVLHISSIGESFGYGIAEPMALGIPVITNSVPWHDQAQLELVRHEECGLVASSPRSLSRAILKLAQDEEFRVTSGERSRAHILNLANPEVSLASLMMAIRCAVDNVENPNVVTDLCSARRAATHLDRSQWGQTLGDRWSLRGQYVRIQCLCWQRQFRDRLKRKSASNRLYFL
jgi:hypothetical protein